MSSLRLVVAVLSGTALSLAGVPRGALGAERLLERQRPLSVRWGEVEVAETALVKVARAGTEATYPNAIALVFKTRLREEEMQGLLDRTSKARSQTETVGTLYVAGRMAEGRAAWDRFVVRLQEAAGRLTPAAYDEFLANSSAVGNAAHPEPGDFAIGFCVQRPGASDFEGDLVRTTVKTDKGSGTTTGTSGYPPGKGPYCGPLREAFQGRAAVDVLTTGFSVDDSLEETLDLVVQERVQQPPVALPEGVTLSLKDAPEGVKSFRSTSREKSSPHGSTSLEMRSSRSTSQDGKVHGETLRREGDDSSGQGRGKDILVVVDLSDTTLARDLPRGRSVVTRWDVSRRETRLGAPPRTLSEDRQTLLMGVFCTTESCSPTLDSLGEAVAVRLAGSTPILSAAEVQRAIEYTRLSLPPEALLVFCPPGSGRDRSATYCLSNACAKVLNPVAVCGDLEVALPQ